LLEYPRMKGLHETPAQIQKRPRLKNHKTREAGLNYLKHIRSG
jgi:hypothetical protein